MILVGMGEGYVLVRFCVGKVILVMSLGFK